MKEEILVEVGYYDFHFEHMEQAAAFAEMAARHIDSPDRGVSLSLKFINEGEDEDGED